MTPATAVEPPHPAILLHIISSSETEPGEDAHFDVEALQALIAAQTVDLDDVAWDCGLSLDALMDILEGRADPAPKLRARWEREIAARLAKGSG